MTLRIPGSIDVGTVAVDLAAFDSLLVSSRTVLHSSGGNAAVVATGNNQVITIAGTVQSDSSNGIRFGDNETDTGGRIHIRAGGELFGGDDAIDFTCGGLQIVNDGIIGGVYGIYANGASLTATDATSFVNNGLIITDSTSVFLSMGNSGGYTLRNTGDIMSIQLSGNAYSSSGTTTMDRIYNSGTMEGAIFLGGGNDLYSGATGRHIKGVIDGAAGNDTLIGGADRDRLAGGAGRDVLTGNAGADQFVFDSALNATTNVDRITALSTVDKIILYEAVFANVGPSVTAGEFKVIATGTSFATVDPTDRIIYLRSTGDLYFDADGSETGSARVRFADLPANTNVLVTQFEMLLL